MLAAVVGLYSTHFLQEEVSRASYTREKFFVSVEKEIAIIRTISLNDLICRPDIENAFFFRSMYAHVWYSECFFTHLFLSFAGLVLWLTEQHNIVRFQSSSCNFLFSICREFVVLYIFSTHFNLLAGGENNDIFVWFDAVGVSVQVMPQISWIRFTFTNLKNISYQRALPMRVSGWQTLLFSEALRKI